MLPKNKTATKVAWEKYALLAAIHTKKVLNQPISLPKKPKPLPIKPFEPLSKTDQVD